MTTNEISIRPYNSVEDASKAFYELAETAFTYGAPWSKKQYEQTLSRPDLIFFVAKQNDELIGYVGGKLMVDEAEIYSIAIKKSFQNKKIASKLIVAFKQYCQTKGMTTLYLEVRESNTKARLFYEAHAFSEIAERKQYYTRPIEDAIIMKCNLGKKEEDEKEADFSN